jgi:hypothetical protein
MDMDQEMKVLFCVVCWSALAMSVTAFLFFLGLSLKHISSDDGKMKATSHAATPGFGRGHPVFRYGRST